MRKILLLFAFAPFLAGAQTSKGSFMVGGSMNFQRYDGSTTTPNTLMIPSNSFAFTPNIGYFFIDNLAAGIVSSLAVTKSKGSGYESKSTTTDAGVFTRYYIRFGKFAAFPEISARWGKQKFSSTYPAGSPVTSSEAELKSSRYKGGAGVAWFVASNVALEGIFSYTNTQEKAGFKTTEKNIGFNVGLQFFIPAKASSD